MSHAGAEQHEDDQIGIALSTAVSLDDTSRIGEARRAALSAGIEAGLTPGQLSNLGIVVTEIVTNTVRYATGGQLIVQVIGTGDRRAVELICIDRGPGMANVAECLRDGYSSRGTMGTGLGAISRIADDFHIHSKVDAGTVVVARFSPSGKKGLDHDTRVATLCLPVKGEVRSGDGGAFHPGGTRKVFLLVDGLGHGPLAAEATAAAVRIFCANAHRPPKEVLNLIHSALLSTRGAAGAIAEIDRASRNVRFAGVGNIAGWIVTETASRAMVSHNGILGHQLGRVQEFEYPLLPDATLIMHSDGLSNKWKTDRYPGLLRRDPALLAAVLYRDSGRERDDRCILVYRP